ncbi:hypothetical protein [Streptomyces mirabilis]|uniref:hypothetical protein n=1 Tax=Streptomyces mirabilis TaxID=68239 RepID=UPI003406A467
MASGSAPHTRRLLPTDQPTFIVHKSTDYEVTPGTAYVDMDGGTWESLGVTTANGLPVFASADGTKTRTLAKLAPRILHKVGDSAPESFEFDGRSWSLSDVLRDNDEDGYWGHNGHWRRTPDGLAPLFTRPDEPEYALTIAEIARSHCRDDGRPKALPPGPGISFALTDGTNWSFDHGWRISALA